MQSISIRHVDTCLACYVLDHCNGERETLLGVAVDHESNYASVKRDLLTEWLAGDLDGKSDAPDDAAFTAELESEFGNGADPGELFAPSLEAPDEDDDSDVGETVYAWFRVSWDAVEPPALDVAAARLLDLVTRRGGIQGNPWSTGEVRALAEALTGEPMGDVIAARPELFSDLFDVIGADAKSEWRSNSHPLTRAQAEAHAADQTRRQTGASFRVQPLAKAGAPDAPAAPVASPPAPASAPALIPGAINKASALGVAIFQHDGATYYTPGPSADFQPADYRGPYYGASEAASAALVEREAREASDIAQAESQGYSVFMSMGAAYWAPAGVAVSGNTHGRGWRSAGDTRAQAAVAALQDHDSAFLSAIWAADKPKPGDVATINGRAYIRRASGWQRKA